MECGDVNCTELPQRRVQWQVLVLAVLNLGVRYVIGYVVLTHLESQPGP